MSVSPDDAAAALRDIDAIETRSARAFGYQCGSPHLILWGALWVVGYGLCDLMPERAALIWAVIVPVGLAGSLRVYGSDRRRRYFAGIAATMVGFFFAAFAVLTPRGLQVAALIPLMIGAAYVVMGLWRGPRYVATGLAVAALTLGGYFLLPAHFLLWQAVVGGGAMVLAGLWFKTL